MSKILLLVITIELYLEIKKALNEKKKIKNNGRKKIILLKISFSIPKSKIN
jgi:hypothetical protein